MGFLSEIKKLLFASKSVAKHQGEKGIEYGMEKGAEIASKGKDVLEDVGGNILDKTTGLRDAVLEKSGDTLGSLKDTAGDTLGSLKDTAGDALGSLKDTASKTYDDLADNELVNKAGDFAENVGSKVIETGGDLLDKAGDVKDDLVEKAKVVTDKMSDKLDETYEKAKAFEAEEALKPKGEFAEDTIDAGGSLLEGTDDFFSKADKYADGDYGAFSEGKTTISKPDNLELPEKPAVVAAGFEDLDGDGDEIIDDAVVITEDVAEQVTEKPLLLDDGVDDEIEEEKKDA